VTEQIRYMRCAVGSGAVGSGAAGGGCCSGRVGRR
jgi:hypothetical protein